MLRSLQKEAPKVPAEVMEYEVRGALKNFDDLFESMESEAFAAASIGQVHRGRLSDGRPVAVKIQYPLIDEIVKADLKSLRVLLQSLFALVSAPTSGRCGPRCATGCSRNSTTQHEADNADRMIALHAAGPGDRHSVGGSRGDDAQRPDHGAGGGHIPGRGLLGSLRPGIEESLGSSCCSSSCCAGLLEHRFLHADPNLANFAFLPDGRVVVYDLGCVKRIPDLADGYAELLLAAAEGARRRCRGSSEIASTTDGAAVAELMDPYVDPFGPCAKTRLTSSARTTDSTASCALGFATVGGHDIQFPQDIVFVDRALAGHFGNLSKAVGDLAVAEILSSTMPRRWRPGVSESEGESRRRWVDGFPNCSRPLAAATHAASRQP